MSVPEADPEVTDRGLAPEWACARHGRIGRRVRGWMREIGLTAIDLDTAVLAFTEFDAADRVLGIEGRIERSVSADAIAAPTAETWLGSLEAADESGTFFASLSMYTVAGSVSDPSGDSER